LLVMVPTAPSAFQSPDAPGAGAIVIIFFGALFWGGVAAIGGAVAGALAGKKGKPLHGMLIGISLAAPVVVCYNILFSLPHEPILDWFSAFFGAVVGGVSGAVGALMGRRANIRKAAPGPKHD
jgi:hypothetical protein